jgi:hypothetical protein
MLTIENTQRMAPNRTAWRRSMRASSSMRGLDRCTCQLRCHAGAAPEGRARVQSRSEGAALGQAETEAGWMKSLRSDLKE